MLDGNSSVFQLFAEKEKFVLYARWGKRPFASALLLSYLLRFEFNIPDSFLRQLLALLPAAVALKIAFSG